MNVQIARNGEVIGSYEAKFIEPLLESGQILPTDSFWIEGMGAWEPVSRRWNVAVPPPLPPSSAAANSLPAGLLPCPSCRSNVSRQAEICPQCGHPLKRGFMGKPGTERALNLGCLFLIVVFFMLLLLWVA
jgi:hypothetical protein